MTMSCKLQLPFAFVCLFGGLIIYLFMYLSTFLCLFIHIHLHNSDDELVGEAADS